MSLAIFIFYFSVSTCVGVCVVCTLYGQYVIGGVAYRVCIFDDDVAYVFIHSCILYVLFRVCRCLQIGRNFLMSVRACSLLAQHERI